LDEDVDQINLV